MLSERRRRMVAPERDPPENEMAHSLAEDDYKTANVGEIVPLTEGMS